MIEVTYINVNRSTVMIQIVLKTRRYYMGIAAEPWIYRRKEIPPATVSHPKYSITNHIYHDIYLVCYARKDISITANMDTYKAEISIKTEEDLIRIIAIYLPPNVETDKYRKEV